MKEEAKKKEHKNSNYDDIGRVTLSSELPGREAIADFAQNVVMPETLASFVVFICTDPGENCTLALLRQSLGQIELNRKTCEVWTSCMLLFPSGLLCSTKLVYYASSCYLIVQSWG